ncbi:MAG: efflux RND transporter periplasmic adaptor subunit [Myxococcaceae bacterium]
MASNPSVAFDRAPPMSIQRRSQKRRLIVFGILGLLLVVGLLVGIKASQIVAMIQAGKAFVPPPEAVTSTKAERSTWRGTREAIGSLVAVRGVTLGAEVPGRVLQISFESGSSVKQGQVLVRLDASIEQAQLESARAEAALAQLNLTRAYGLREGGANTPADLETAQARGKQAEAAAASLLASLSKKVIRAPFDGRITIRQVELGQIVSPGTPIASLHSVSPIYAEFSLPQQALAEVKQGQKVSMRTDIFPNETWEGEVAIINAEVDTATRNVRVRAEFKNTDGRLAPGMFANVEVLSPEARQVTVIPATAVLYAPYGDSVYVLEQQPGPDGKTGLVARQRFVRLGERRGDFVAVVSGLEPDETVVSSGAFKLRNGMSVVVNNALAPAAELAPKPATP